MAAAPLTAGAVLPDLTHSMHSMHTQSRQRRTDGAVPFPRGNISGGNAFIEPSNSSEGKERSQELDPQHLAMIKSSRIRQRTASDGLLDDLFCDSSAGQDVSITNSELPEDLASPSEGKMSPASPFFPREGWTIVGQPHARHHRRRSSYAISSHTRGQSSSGAASDLDYFGSSSFASTAPTSVQSVSPIHSRDHYRTSQPEQGCESCECEILSPSAYQERCMPDSGRTIDERATDTEAETPAEEGQAIEQALPTVPSPQTLLADDNRIDTVSSSECTGSRPLVSSRGEDTATIPPTSTNPSRQSLWLNRCESAPVVFASTPASDLSGASTPVRPTLERSYISVAGLEPPPSHDQSYSSPRASAMSQPLRTSLMERGPVPKASFWRRHTHTDKRSAGSPTSNSTPASLYEGRPTTPSSLRFSRATFRRTTSSSSTGSSSRRFPEVAKSLFTGRSEPRSSEASRAARINAVASDSASRPQRAALRSTASSSAAVEVAASSHLFGSRRPTLLRAALSSPLGASTAVTPLNSAGAKTEREHKVDYFHVLPRELQVQIFTTLIRVHITEQEDNVARGVYRGRRAREMEYVGMEAAMKEMIKISRVSKSWMALALDGQLWTELKVMALPGLSRSGLMKLAKGAGSFVREIDVTGMTGMSDAHVSDLTGHLCGRIAAGPASTSLSATPVTNLTSINLRGLQSISTSTLNYLLSHSPYLISSHLSNLPAVTNHTCIELARSCPKLQVLDVSRCSNVDGEGLDYLQHLTSLEVVKAAGIKHLDSTVMGNLARSLTCLQILDLNYSDLTDACLSAMTDHEGPEGVEREMDSRAFFELSASQSRTSGKTHQYRARLPRLKHLAVSSTSITDRGLLSLAYGALPHLQALEVAHNRGIRDGGLVALLTSSPHLRRLDLEGLTEITDKTLKALTSFDEAEDGSSRRRARQAGPLPGSQLTHLLLSQCRRLHTAPMVALIKSCPNLHHLEVDDTNMDDSFALRCLKQMSANSRLQQANTNEQQPPSYCLSLIDCRNLTRPGCNAMLATNVVRPRLGRRGFRYNPFEYGDSDRPPAPLLIDTSPTPTSNNAPSPSSVTEQVAKMLEDECNEERICVKTFWYWQAIDAKERKLRKKEKKTLIGRKKMTIAGGSGSGSGSGGRNGTGTGNGSGSGSGSSSPLGGGGNGTEGTGMGTTESAVRGLSRALLGGGRSSSGSGSSSGGGGIYGFRFGSSSGAGSGSGSGSGSGLGFSRGNRRIDGRVFHVPSSGTSGTSGGAGAGPLHLNGARGHAHAQAQALAQGQTQPHDAAQAQAQALAPGVELEIQEERDRTSPLVRLSRLASGLFAPPAAALASPFPEEEGEEEEEEEEAGREQQLEEEDDDDGQEGDGAIRGEDAFCVVM